MEQKLNQLKRWEKQHHKQVLALAVVIVVIAAFAFFALNEKSDTIPAGASESSKVLQEEETAQEVKEEKPTSVFVDIAGAVKKPGVYEIEPEARIYEVVDKAGGLTKDADTSMMNLAERVNDGMKIVIPAEGTVVSQGGQSDSYNSEQTGGSGGSATTPDGKVNINQADAVELQAINGIGPVTADSIIAYREENGLFRTPEDLKKVRGIGEKTFEKIKDQVII